MAYIWGTARGFAQVMATSAQAASYSDVERSSKFVSVYRKHPFSPIFLPRAIRRISYGTKKTVDQWSRYFEVIHLTVGNTTWTKYSIRLLGSFDTLPDFIEKLNYNAELTFTLTRT